MQPRLRVINSPQGNTQPQPQQNQGFSFLGGTGNLEVFEDDVIRASNAARNEGIGEREINNSLQEYLKQRAQRAQAAQQQEQLQAEQGESRNGLLDFLLPTIGSVGGVAGGASLGATVGSIVPGVGTAIGGGIGALLGGAFGGAGGQIVSNKAQGKNFKDHLGSEALFGAAGGAGKLFKLARGGSAAAKGLGVADDVVGAGDDVAKSLGLIDDIGKTNPDDLSKIGRAGQRLRLKASGLDDSRVLDTASKQFGAQDVLESVGLKGSSTKKFEQADTVLKSLSKQTDDILTKNTNVAPIKSVRKTITDRASQEIVSDRSTYNRSVNEALDELGKLGGKTGELTAKSASEFKQKLGNRLGSAFKKLQNGTDLTPEQAANMAVWRSLDDVIVDLAPEAKRLTKTQSVLIDALPSLRKASKESVGVPFTSGLKLETPSKLIQAFQDNAGRLLEKSGGAGTKAITGGGRQIPDLVKQFGAQGIPRAVFGGYANPMQIPQDDGLGGLGLDDGGIGIADEQAFQQFTQQAGLDPVQAAADPEVVNAFNEAFIADQMQSEGFITDPELGALTPGGFNAGMRGAGISPEAFGQVIPREAIIEAIIADFDATGGQNADNLINFFEFANQTGSYAPPEAEASGGLDLNNTAITSIAETQAGLDQLDALKSTFERSNVNNPILGRLRGLNPFDSEAQNFEGELALTRQIIGKALEGGVLRKEDEVKYATILPTRGDTDETAILKLDRIKSDIQNKLNLFIQNQQQFGGGGSTETDGLAALGLI